VLEELQRSITEQKDLRAQVGALSGYMEALWPKVGWVHAGNDGEFVSFPPGTRLRYGHDKGHWIGIVAGDGCQPGAHTIDLAFCISPTVGGALVVADDPAPGMTKTLQRWSENIVPPWLDARREESIALVAGQSTSDIEDVRKVVLHLGDYIKTFSEWTETAINHAQHQAVIGCRIGDDRANKPPGPRPVLTTFSGKKSPEEKRAIFVSGNGIGFGGNYCKWCSQPGTLCSLRVTYCTDKTEHRMGFMFNGGQPTQTVLTVDADAKIIVLSAQFDCSSYRPGDVSAQVQEYFNNC
jgi:hypothetical protein